MKGNNAQHRHWFKATKLARKNNYSTLMEKVLQQPLYCLQQTESFLMPPWFVQTVQHVWMTSPQEFRDEGMKEAAHWMSTLSEKTPENKAKKGQKAGAEGYRVVENFPILQYGKFEFDPETMRGLYRDGERVDAEDTGGGAGAAAAGAAAEPKLAGKRPAAGRAAGEPPAKAHRTGPGPGKGKGKGKDDPPPFTAFGAQPKGKDKGKGKGKGGGKPKGKKW
jgi:hypothetical protein